MFSLRCLVASAVAALASSVATQAGSSSLLIFENSGVKDSEGTLVWYPAEKLDSISIDAVPEMLSRVLSVTHSSEVEGALPTGDPFNRPKANLFVTAEEMAGLMTASNSPYTHSLLANGASFELTSVHGSLPVASTLLPSVKHALPADDAVCMSVDASLCTGARSIVWDEKTSSFRSDSLPLPPAAAATLRASPSVEAAATALPLVRAFINGGGEVALLRSGGGEASGVKLSRGGGELVLSLAAGGEDVMVLEQLHVFTMLASSSSSSEGMELFFVSLSGLKTDASASAGAAGVLASLVDAAVEAGVGELSSRFPRGLVGELLLLQPATVSMSVSGAGSANKARILVGDASDSSSTGLTNDEIADYQVVLWTALSLVAILLATIWNLCFMDLGRDSLLYANFQADVDTKMD